ncbi:MAG: biotin/lipoyl-containing protein, partial [Sphaerochaeta sp.]|nr:biotin/lipoyl-containing protein [Sphaerochaeta sp.]
MALKQILIPDIGDFEDVPIIDVYIKVGDVIDSDSSVVALESEKAVLDVPSPFAGTITKVLLKEGDTVSKGSLVAEIEVASEGEEMPVEEPKKEQPEEPKKEEKTEPPKQEEKPEPVAEVEKPIHVAKE